MKENITDLEQLETFKQSPRLFVDPKTKAIQVENKTLCKDIKDLQKRLKVLEEHYAENRKSLFSLQQKLKKYVNQRNIINNSMIALNGHKSK